MPRILDGYLTPEQVAAELNKSVVTLTRWRCKKTGPPFIKNGNTVLYARKGADPHPPALQAATQLLL
jgi:hypothetical protein